MFGNFYFQLYVMSRTDIGWQSQLDTVIIIFKQDTTRKEIRLCLKLTFKRIDILKKQFISFLYAIIFIFLLTFY